jgi:hypothetical protein
MNIIDNELRRAFVLNNEELYRAYLSVVPQMTLRSFVKLHRVKIDTIINQELNKKPSR